MSSVPDATITEDGKKYNIWKDDRGFIVGGEVVKADGSVLIGKKVLAAMARLYGFELIEKNASRGQSTTPVADPGLVAVLYIGRRETQVEPQFGTGTWIKDQIKNVPLATANRLVKEYPGVFKRHYELKDQPGKPADFGPPVTANGPSVAKDMGKPTGEAKEAPEVKAAEEAKEADAAAENELQDARDLVSTLDIEGLKEFAYTNFGQKLHHKIGVDKARQRVTQMVDQFGLP